MSEFLVMFDESLELWCRPLHDGQVIEVLHGDMFEGFRVWQSSDNGKMWSIDNFGIPGVRRYVADRKTNGDLVWERIHTSYKTMPDVVTKQPHTNKKATKAKAKKKPAKRKR